MNISISISEIPQSEREYDYKTYGDYEIISIDGGCAITKYEGTDEDVVIPNTINGEVVVAIGDGEYKEYPYSKFVFGSNDTLKSVTIPAGVTSIDQQTFVECYPEAIHINQDNLSYASEDGVLFNKEKTHLIRYPIARKNECYTVPDGVKVINMRAFWGCKFINLILPEGLERIEIEAIHECRKLTDIEIPNSVEYIGFNAFCNCYSLKKVILPDNNTIIDDCAFYNCDNLQQITITESIAIIGIDAFPENTKIHIDENNPNFIVMDRVLFNKNKKSLIRYPSNKRSSIYKIPDEITYIEDNAFFGCDSLTNVIFSDSLTGIGNSSFSYCRNLTNLTFPKSLINIGENAFSSCSSLSMVTLPDNLNSIEESTFEHCVAIDNITITKNITSIGDSAFSCCKNLRNITIPNTVTKIGKFAFSRCESLECISIPDSVEEIGIHAFSECKQLKSISISKKLTTISSGMLEHCRKLKNIVIPDSVTVIDYHAFEACNSLTNINIPDSVINIEDYAFSSCCNLESINLPCNIKEFGNGVFAGCYNLKNINMDSDEPQFCFEDNILFSSDKTILYLYMKQKKNSYTVPDGVKEIKRGAFTGCKNLVGIMIPKSVTIMDNFLFLPCKNLSSIKVDYKNKFFTAVDDVLFSKDKTTLIHYPAGKTDSEYSIPDGITDIMQQAFNGITLRKVNIPDSVANIEFAAFTDCKKLKEININNKKECISIGEIAFPSNATVSYICDKDSKCH